jgi:hypothetical protein
VTIEQQQRIFDALRTITKDYQTSDQIRRTSIKNYGLECHEALEMAYDNLQAVAKHAIKRIKRPK